MAMQDTFRVDPWTMSRRQQRSGAVRDVHVALTQTLADLDRLRARRAWPAELDSIWEVLDQIKEAVKLGEFLRRQALLTCESFAPLTEIIGTVIDEWPQGSEAVVSVLEPVIAVIARAAEAEQEPPLR